MSLIQSFDVYQYSESGTDRGGSPVHVVVRVFENANGVFLSPDSKTIKEWFGETIELTQALVVRHNLANDPLGQISVFVYLDLDEYPFLYVVLKDALSVYNRMPFRVIKVAKGPRSGMIESNVLALRRPAPDERVQMWDGLLEAISG